MVGGLTHLSFRVDNLDAAIEAVGLIDPASGTRVIDASSAHRTSEGWCYGFPELVGAERVASARRVSNPGCYPTSAILALGPLLRSGVVESSDPKRSAVTIFFREAIPG